MYPNVNKIIFFSIITDDFYTGDGKLFDGNVGSLAGFYGILTIVGYVMTNQFHTNGFKWIVCW